MTRKSPPLPPRFINWRLHDARKVPCAPDGSIINAHDTTKHLTLDKASESAHGLAFAMVASDGWFFLDLDKCYDANVGWTPEAEKIFTSFAGAWGEISQSGHGLHIMGRCDPSRLTHLRNRWDGWLEFYTDRRMVAFGGRGWKVIEDGEDTGKDFTDLILQTVPPREEATQPQVAAPIQPSIPDDETLIKKMLASTGGAGAKFGLKCKVADLWNGNQAELVRHFPSDTSIEGFDHSSADLALMRHLAFWTGCDRERMDRLFRNSALVRAKYERRQDYRNRTIEKAISGTDDVYRDRSLSSTMPTAAALSLDQETWGTVPDDLLGLGQTAPPELNPADYLTQELAKWTVDAAAAKSAPVDYVFFAVLAVAASLIGNARRAKPQPGWTEATGLWVMAIGKPSAGKSPALDAVLDVLMRIEEPLQANAKRRKAEWSQKQQVAAVYEKDWKKACENALKNDDPLPPQPEFMKLPEEPHLPRLIITDGTIERLAMISAAQSKGILQVRDELSGWLEGMTRYSNTSDRPFWLEATGGRPYSIERVGREAVTIPRLLISVLGGIQPDRLNSLLVRADDDGLLARFIPVWPDPVPLAKNVAAYSDELLYRVFNKLQGLGLRVAMDLSQKPVDLEFDPDAKELFFGFRERVKSLEAHHEGFFVSFLGKTPGLAARLALVRANLRWASIEGELEPTEISAQDISSAIQLVEKYILPMAARTYGAFAGSPERIGAAKVLQIIKDKQFREFTARDVHRAAGKTIRNANELHKYLNELVHLGVIRAVDENTSPKIGRPSMNYVANPHIWDH